MRFSGDGVRLVDLPGPPGDAGFTHGRVLADLLWPAFLDAYEDALSEAIGFDRSGLRAAAMVWLGRLPGHYQEEVDGMARGAGVSLEAVARFLYADIADARGASTTARIRGDQGGPGGSVAGPMCSSLLGQLGGDRSGRVWAARNCDWLVPTLMRGTSAVAHASPGRHPVLAVGIHGDIDIDTGMNAAGLWLHLHTLATSVKKGEDAGDDRPEISWLFWCREALEVCASIEELQAFIKATRRDRSVFAVAAEGRGAGGGRCAVFECSPGDYVRRDVEPGGMVCLTNHSLSKEYPERAGPAVNPAGTVSRYQTLRRLTRERPIVEGPRDFAAALAADGVEMRTPKHLRTIYSAIAEPGTGSIWFASGGADGTPAASGGTWSRVRPPWKA